MIIALSLGGRLSFNPLKDELTAADGTKFKLEPPKPAPEVPSEGFMRPQGIYVAPPENSDNVEVIIDPQSKRLQKLAPFTKWDGKDFEKVPIIIKAKGKCTTDHVITSYSIHYTKLYDISCCNNPSSRRFYFGLNQNKR